ncbi:MAG TPA: RES domain-containing protein [Gammaproteobacteria bacterium]|nr:RES domain-containing protein [Gammaproteobacteria bacterium]
MTASRYCCPRCFGDLGLEKDIIPTLSNSKGKCDYCFEMNTLLVEPSKLKDYFEQVINIYKEEESGIVLVELLKEDWGLFSNLDIAHSKELLADIIDDGQIVRKRFTPSELCKSDRLTAWVELRNELMYQNRYFPNTEIDEDRFVNLLSFLTTTLANISDSWYRARIQKDEHIIDIKEMGAPPNNIASHGRANPAGIPYLYLASDEKTAVSEVRPHTGEFISVANFEVDIEMKVVDLRSPKTTISPFLLGDENEIAMLRGDIEFLVHLANELTRPVLPGSASIEYIPSQYLCELIKKQGYHGVIYNSSVGNGINLALFNPGNAAAKSVEKHQVSCVSVEIENTLEEYSISEDSHT